MIHSPAALPLVFVLLVLLGLLILLFEVRILTYAYRKIGGTAPAKLWSSGKITSTQPSPP